MRSKRTLVLPLVLLVLMAGAGVAFAGGQAAKAEQVVLKVWDQFMEEGLGMAGRLTKGGEQFIK